MEMSDYTNSNSYEEPESTPRGIHQLIPHFVREMCKKPQSVELRVSYDAQKLQSTYTYSLRWEDDADHQKEFEQVMEKMEKGKIGGDGESGKSASVSRGAVLPVPALCDGPCKKSFPSNLLNTIGRCGHYLCVACYGIVKNSDGTNGCSAAHCNWAGDTRKEAKKYFEKEICQKQRIRAREMKNVGVDVKPASSASSSSSRNNSKRSSPTSSSSTKSTVTDSISTVISTVTSTSKSFSEVSEETDCSILLSSPISSSTSSRKSFNLIYPSKQEIIGVKLFILEEMREHTHCSTHVAESEFASCKPVNLAITALIRQKYPKIPKKPRGVLYHVELMPKLKRRLNRIHTKDYQTKALFDFPQIGEHILFILDFGDFVCDGQGVKIG